MSANSLIRWLVRTGSRAGGAWPTPSSSSRRPPVRSASRRPIWAGRTWSSVPWMTTTGHRTCSQSGSSGVASAPRSPSRPAVVSARVWAEMSAAQAMEVLDLLGRVRLVEHLLEEEADEVLEAALEPVVLVVLRPAPGGVEPGVEGELLARRAGHRQPAGRGDADQPAHAVGMSGGHVHRPRHPAREPHEQGPLGLRRVEDGDRVCGVLAIGVRRSAGRAPGATRRPGRRR